MRKPRNRKAYYKAYAETHRKQIKARRKAYLAVHRGEVKAYRKTYPQLVNTGSKFIAHSLQVFDNGVKYWHLPTGARFSQQSCESS